VVSSVQHYSQFVPWCVGSHVLKREQEGRYLEAELQIGFQMISERCGVWVARRVGRVGTARWWQLLWAGSEALVGKAIVRVALGNRHPCLLLDCVPVSVKTG